MIKLFPLILLLPACTSHFGDAAHRFLKTQNETSIAQTIIKNQTTRAEIEQRFGALPAHRNCYEYHESHLPFYNFLPTNMVYMKSVRSGWKLCIQYHQDIVSDYRFKYQTTKNIDSPAGSLIQDIFKSSE